MSCPLCGDRVKKKDLEKHLVVFHESEMEQRHKNPKDPVVNFVANLFLGLKG